MRLQRILVPVDFSVHSEQAGLVAVALANRHGAEVLALHVDPFPGAAAVAVEPVYIPPDLFGGLHADYNRRIDESLASLQELLAKHATTSVTLTTERRTGLVADNVLEYATESKADLIVMGSSGLSGTARLILGSVADKVSRSAPCPVLITRINSDEERPSEPFKRVVVAVDYSPFSGPSMRLGRAVLAPGGSVELVHVWASPYLSALNAQLGGPDNEPMANAIAAARADQADRLESFAEQGELSGVSCFVATGGVPSALLDRVDEIGADLLVLGAHGRRDLGERLLGTTADRVLRHAETSVLLISEDALARWSR
ncbi:universal stress protein [Haliangium sp.]|uniref:universal stress protein n=1 Tax=Haliangium sp. TaxID=2663208 RepID=UPI003D13E628